MKLLRWAMAGASAYVIYKYAIGTKAKGENVFDSPDSDQDQLAPPPPAKPATKPRRPRARKPKAASSD